MMDEFLWMMILATAFAGLLSVSGTGTIEKYACTGDSVKAFQNIDFDRRNAFVSLNINGDRNAPIANWSYQNFIVNATLEEQYKDRVLLSDNGTITINNIHHFDQGKYVVISKMDPLPSIQEVQITVMVAPSKDCKPDITKLENMLIASIQSEICGYPVTTPYWRGSNYVSQTDKAFLTIVPGNEDHTYEACIKGVSLQCERNITQLNHCSTIVVKGQTTATMATETTLSKTTTLSTEACESCSMVGLIAVIIVLAFLLTLCTVAIVILSLIARRYFLMWTDAKKLLNYDELEDQKMHFKCLHVMLSSCTDKLRSPSNDQQQGLETPLARGNRMNEVENENPSDIDQEKNIELHELRNIALCTICFQNEKNVFFVPCSHVATCTNCSGKVEECPLCRRTIKEKKEIRFSD